MAEALGEHPSRSRTQFVSRSTGGQEGHLRAVVIGGFFSGTSDHQDGHSRNAGRQFAHEGRPRHPRQAQAYNHQGKPLLEVVFLNADEGRAGVGNALYADELALESRTTEMSLEWIVVDEKDGSPDSRIGGGRR